MDKTKKTVLLKRRPGSHENSCHDASFTGEINESGLIEPLYRK